MSTAGEKFRGVVRLVGMICCVAVGVTSVLGVLGSGLNFFSLIYCIYQAAMALVGLFSEMKFKFCLKYFRFTIPYAGLGLFYGSFGLFSLSSGRWYDIVVACVCLGICVLYISFTLAGCDRGINYAEIDGYDEKKAAKDAAKKKAVSAAKEANTAENRALIADEALKAAAAENNKGATNKDAHAAAEDNPFENDNPFASGAKSKSKGAYN